MGIHSHQEILILSGGLTIHTFRDFAEWKYESASEPVKEFEREILKACLEESVNFLPPLSTL
jgi:aromatic ring-opening dioxygenase catalytic subunit (LigB family)